MNILTWATIAAPIALVACDGTVATNDPIHPLHYVRGDEFYAARNGAIRVEVEGNTFGLPREPFAARVVNIMRASYYRHDWFTLEASRATDPHYKVVMMFDADISVSGQNLCAAAQPFRPVPPSPGATNRLLAAFCGGSEAISEVAGWAYGGVKGVEDPLFRNLVARVTNSIFPKTASTLDIGIMGSSF